MATDDKYDRQLRLWGTAGQKELMEANILLINAGPTGTETLKNLVLPGVGRFTVLDPATVQPSDLGNNFFVTADKIGCLRAQVTAELLGEMNPDVTGAFVFEDPETKMDKDPAFFSKFSLVIASQLPEGALEKLSKICWESSTPLIFARSYGYLGHVRVTLREHCVTESKPKFGRTDLRIAKPWPELEAYCRSFNLAEQDSVQHGHTPWAVLLVIMILRWKQTHRGALPASREEKKEFYESIKAEARDLSKEVNYAEALKNYYQAFAPSILPPDVQDVIDAPQAAELTASTADFWVMARAMKQFIDGPGEGLPPLGGEIPDMTADTEYFIMLQTIYQEKAAKDASVVAQLVGDYLEAMGRPRDSISADTITHFCKNSRNLLTRTMTTLQDELCPDADAKEEIKDCLEDLDPGQPEQTPLVWYLALRGAERFRARKGHYPGKESAQVEEDAQELWKDIQAMIEDLGLTATNHHLSQKHAEEITRYGASEIHNVAAVVGGIASQEAVKAITKQYTPLENTVIYNGLAGIISAYKL